MPYDSMAAWDRSIFEFNDEIQKRGSSWSGQFSFEFGAGSTISREDYIHPHPHDYVHPTSPTLEKDIPHITDAVFTGSPTASPRASPPPSPRVDSAKSFRESPPPPPEPVRDPKEQTRLAARLYRASCDGNADIIRFLLHLGAPINQPTIIKGLYDAFKPPKPGTLSPLAGAAGNGHLETCELLLSEGAALNPNMKQSSSAPLHQSCKANDVEISRYLLEAGADVDALNCYKTTPLMYCVKYGSPELVALILSYKPDLTITSFINTAAIHWAVWPNHEKTMESLLKVGANPNQMMGDGSTPLHCAAGCGYTDMVKILLQYGSDPRRRNHDGMNAGRVAEVSGHSETAEVLRAAEQHARLGSA